MEKSYSESYAAAGVDITAGYRSVELMKQYVARTMNEHCIGGLGGFGGLFELDCTGYKHPVLISGTDGVGTKLKIAMIMDKHDTIGIDCVAMCVNDVICAGAKPLVFLDYIACGRNIPEKIAEIVKGVAEGCVQADCSLVGGETAEHPGMMPEDEYDLAGFTVGVVDKEKILNNETMQAGDVILALPSTGVHSNGFSLVRKIFDIDANPDVLHTAPAELGGKTLGFAGAQLSSASKGETVADTARVVSNYADVIAMRHPKEGAPLRASLYARVPVINAGDGGHAHPSQTMIDLMTIRQRKGRLDHLTIGFCGDLKFGRTVHSLIKSLSRLPGMRFVLVSPEELRVPDYIISEILEPNGIEYVETRSLEEALPQLDILYMTRVQRERFFNEEDYIRLKNSYVLTKTKLDLAPADMAVLHPLPRVNEITLDVDDDPRAAYFDQVQNGVHMRMALIMTLLGLKDPKTGEVAFDVEG